MDIKTILSAVDHTLLSPTAVWDEIRTVCDDGINFGTASVCIPPSYVKRAKEYVGNRIKICTVIGFPCGYSTCGVKCFETADAVKNGADEIDMVINLGYLRGGMLSAVEDEIRAVRRECPGRVLKVIIETCLLTQQEKIEMCRIVSHSGADFIKTSTGFSTGGATREDVRLISQHIDPHLKIKAAGGIASLRDACDFLALGAERLGTSRIVKLLKEERGNGTAY